MNIPFTLEYTGAEEAAAAARALQTHQLVGNGARCRAVEQQIREQFGARHVLLTTSCTHALEMAMLSLDIGPGDEVILPSFTFVSTANCVVLRGATPVFADVQPDTMNLDPEDVARRITPRTRAILPVHYAGVSCDMDALRDIASAHKLFLVEDAAQGVDATYKGAYLGTMGDFGCYSFHGTKNIVCGEGGALLTNDDELAAKAHIILEKGTNRAAFLQGQVDKYSWVSVGSSYVLSDLLAAVLEVQIGKRDEIRLKRGAIWHRYYEGLRPLADEGRITLPVVPAYASQNYHIFYLHLSTPEARTEVLRELNASGIRATFHYVPLHSSPFGQRMGWDVDSLPNTEYLSRTLLRLPLFPGMSEEQIAHVLERTAALVERYCPRDVVAGYTQHQASL